MVNNNEIKYESKDASIDIKEIIKEIKDFKYEEDLKEVAYQLKKFDDNFSKKILTIDERINIISRLHIMRDVSGWVIGDILLKEENKIKKEIVEWENSKRPNPPRFNTLFDFIKEYEDRLGFGKSTAYDYIRIRKNASIETFVKLGLRKTLIILKIKNNDIAAKLLDSAIQHKWTCEELSEKYAEYIEKEKLQKELDFSSNKKRINKKVVINTHIVGNRIKKNELLLSFKNESERDTFNEILQDLMPKIKRKMLLAKKID